MECQHLYSISRAPLKEFLCHITSLPDYIEGALTKQRLLVLVLVKLFNGKDILKTYQFIKCALLHVGEQIPCTVREVQLVRSSRGTFIGFTLVALASSFSKDFSLLLRKGVFAARERSTHHADYEKQGVSSCLNLSRFHQEWDTTRTPIIGKRNF